MSHHRNCRRILRRMRTGKGWAGCQADCTPDASFAAQAEPLAEIRTLEAYCELDGWIAGFIPNGSYAIKAFATDEARRSVCAYGVFSGTDSGEGGPCPPTGKTTHTDYV